MHFVRAEPTSKAENANLTKSMLNYFSLESAQAMTTREPRLVFVLWPLSVAMAWALSKEK